jgi:quercetin dioxygenase-like cupin family protein
MAESIDDDERLRQKSDLVGYKYFEETLTLLDSLGDAPHPIALGLLSRRPPMRALLMAGIVLLLSQQAGLGQSQATTKVPQTRPKGSPPPKHITLTDRPWTSSEQYPEALRRVYRYKALVGGRRPGVIPQSDVLMGMLELAPRATYPAHKHPAPELYYVMSGTAEWTVGDETFTAGPGTAIYHPPNTLHRMVNAGDEVLRTVYMWWAPGGNRQVIKVPSELLEGVPEQPVTATFNEP